MKHNKVDIAIIGAGIIGIATAYYLKKISPNTTVLLIDAAAPMSLTSAHSGENYRNWWPHPIMTAFTDRSISLMETLACETNNLINMNRRGYVLATRSNDTDQLMSELEYGYSQLLNSEIRIQSKSLASYQPPDSPDWRSAPSGVDVINNQHLIRKTFPSFDHSINTIIHIRRAGAISAQQMGLYMMQYFKQCGGLFLQTEVKDIGNHNGFKLYTTKNDAHIRANHIVNAAGPFIDRIARMLSVNLPVHNTLQQKIAFEDTAKSISRKMPFSIDLDAQAIDWTEQERELLIESDDHRWLTQEMPGSIHCRPEGGDNGSWLKLGWAFNHTASAACHTPALMESFPEIVLRGAARLNPSLKQYYSHIPRSMHHYGGFYTLTKENWPLIGRMSTDSKLENAYVVGAMSGFGTMAACAAGELCALLIKGEIVPDYAHALSPQRYENQSLMNQIHAMSQKGIL